MRSYSLMLAVVAAPLMAQAPSQAPAPATGPAAAPAAPAAGASSAAERMMRSTVKVWCKTAWGSGVVVGDGVTVITNNHVVEACNAESSGAEIAIRAANGADARGVVVRSFPDVDLSVIRIAGSLPVEAAPLRNDALLKVMQPIIVVGHPGVATLGGVGEDRPRITMGTVSRESRQDPNRPRWLVEHTAPSFPGNSGGPVFDECGAVVAILTFGRIEQNGMGAVPFAVGSRTVEEKVPGVVNQAPEYLTTPCGAPAEQKAEVIRAQAAATANPEVMKKVDMALARFSRWEKDFTDKQVARDSAVGELVNYVQGQVNQMQPQLASVASATQAQAKSIAALETQWTDMEGDWQREKRKLWYGVAGVFLVAAGALGIALVTRKRVALAELKVEGVENRLAAVEQKVIGGGARGVLQRASQLFGVGAGSNAQATRAIAGGKPALASGRGVTLTLSDGAGNSTHFVPDGATAIIGRDPAPVASIGGTPVLVRLTERGAGGEVSRSHCAVQLEGTTVWITDLGSTNGTRINAGAPIAPHARTAAPDGASVNIGKGEYTVRVQVTDPSRTKVAPA